MLIGEVIKETGLTRKAIYFYEEKGLISPRKDEKNGVRIYSEEDKEKLITILRLRQLDMSLSTIESVFEDPNTMEHALQKQSNILQERLNEIVESMGNLSTILKNFPPNGSLNSFEKAADIVMSRTLDNEWNLKIKNDMPVGYVRRVTMQLYESFLDLPLDSPERWNAWNSLLDKVEQDCTEETIIACEGLFGNWDVNQMYRDFHLRRDLVYGYTKFTPKEYKEKSEELILSLKRLVSNKVERNKWIDYYVNFVEPVLDMSSPELEYFITKLSSNYSKYHKNFKHLLEYYINPFMLSEEGIALRKQLKEVLGITYKEEINVINFFDFYNNTVNFDYLIKNNKK